jgi:hypothetical protein
VNDTMEIDAAYHGIPPILRVSIEVYRRLAVFLDYRTSLRRKNIKIPELCSWVRGVGEDQRNWERGEVVGDWEERVARRSVFGTNILIRVVDQRLDDFING